MNPNSPANPANSRWITIVLITAVIMLVFLVFYGNKASTPMPQPENTANATKSETG